MDVRIVSFAALLMTGFPIDAGAQASSSLVVRARGTAGGESITLRIDNSNVATWTLTTGLHERGPATHLADC